MKCARCDGLLFKDYERGPEDEREVIKCAICGHRVAERSIVAPQTARKEKPTPKNTPTPKRISHNYMAICKACGKVRTIVGRGLCSTCYKRHKKAGTLDRFPSKKTERAARS